MKIALTTLALSLLTAGTATAQPIDLTGVDPCARAESLARKDAEPATILVYWQRCGDTGRDVAQRIGELEDRLDRAGYVTLTVVVDPAVAGAVGFVDALGKVPFPLPGVVRVPPGTHQIGAIAPGHHGAAQHVTFAAHSMPATLRLRLDVADAAPTTSDVDFSDDAEAAEPTTADDLPDAEHDELLKAKFRRGLEADTGAAVSRGHKRHALGVAAGLSMADLHGGAAPSGGARVGVSAALLVSYRITHSVALMPELGYVQRGADGAGIDYLSIPVRLGYVRGLGPVGVHGAAGPELAIAVSSSVPMAEAQTMALGFGAGAGVRVPLGPGAALVDVYLRLGFTDAVDGSSARDRSATLRAGYMY